VGESSAPVVVFGHPRWMFAPLQVLAALVSSPAGISPIARRPPRLSASPRILTSFDRID
jgi:hypothetical protein